MRANNGLWLFGDRVTLNVMWGSMWDMTEMPFMNAHTNKWRLGDRCLSLTLRIWRLDLNMVIWNMPFQNGRND